MTAIRETESTVQRTADKQTSRELPVRVRIAPSPTGFIHIGLARTALFNWLFARQHGGSFVLRIEDTDKERSKPEYEKDILDNLRWLGIDWDEGPDKGGPFAPYRQSERVEIYKKHLEKLLSEKKAYFCFCSKEQLDIDRQTMLAEGLPPKYTGRCRGLSVEESAKKIKNGESSVIRFVTPEKEIEFNDMVRGKVKFDASLIGDTIIAKSLNEPLYNFAAIVDDELMEITHIIRGEEHLSNTPKQILIQQVFGFRPLKYAHIPLILNPDRSKMSKRYLDSSLRDYREQGYLPEAIINFLALLGWHPKNDREILNLEELTKEFDIKRVQKAGAVFNVEKLNWINSQNIKKLGGSETVKLLEPFLKAEKIKASPEFVEKIVDAERERAKTLKDFLSLGDFFFKLPDYEPKLIIWKNEPISEIKNSLNESLEILKGIENEDFKKEKISEKLRGLTEKRGRGIVFWPLRAAVSGKEASPDPLVIMEILGKKETENRIKKALDKLNSLIV
ncbi:MAG: glutamate--tRNA ligase [Patescibacteria group bacterium]